MDQVAQALTMYSRLQACDNWDLQENVDQKLVPVQSSVAKTFEDIKILIVLNMKGIVSNRFSTATVPNNLT